MKNNTEGAVKSNAQSKLPKTEKIEIHLKEDMHDDLIHAYVDNYMMPTSKQVFADYLHTHTITFALKAAVINEMVNYAMVDLVVRDE